MAAGIGIVASIYKIRESRMKIKAQKQGQKGYVRVIDQQDVFSSEKGKLQKKQAKQRLKAAKKSKG
ncbi:MAG: hypothetical protein V3W43_06790 [Desulfatiglandaceae bacterium]